VWDHSHVAQRLHALSELDPGLRRFGAAQHQYGLLPPLTEPQVRAFEQTHGVRLPEGYRTFVRDIGDGGAGPYYRILPLLGTRGRDREDAEKLLLLAEVFPHEQAWNRAGPRQPGPAESEEAFFGRVQGFEEEYFAPKHTAGSIAICQFGCGDWIRLVITGPQRGTLWQDGRSGDYGVWPLNTTFSQWYTAWLTTGDRHRT
jgi:SMI1 / KNR4 family (SUKH-1)